MISKGARTTVLAVVAVAATTAGAAALLWDDEVPTVIVDPLAERPDSAVILEPLPPGRPPAAPLRPYDFTRAEPFTALIPVDWTAQAAASGEGTSVSFQDPASGGSLTICFFHEFVSEAGARQFVEREPRPVATADDGAVNLGHHGARWYAVRWRAPREAAESFRAQVDNVLRALKWTANLDSRLVKGEVAEHSPSLRVLRLTAPDQNVTQVLQDGATRLSWDNGRPASAAEIRPGTRIEATGVMWEPGALLAKQIILYSGQPEVGVG